MEKRDAILPGHRALFDTESPALHSSVMMMKSTLFLISAAASTAPGMTCHPGRLYCGHTLWGMGEQRLSMCWYPGRLCIEEIQEAPI